MFFGHFFWGAVENPPPLFSDSARGNTPCSESLRKAVFCAAFKSPADLFFSHGTTRKGTWHRAVAGYTWAAGTEFFDPTGGWLEMLQQILVGGFN